MSDSELNGRETGVGNAGTLAIWGFNWALGPGCRRYPIGHPNIESSNWARLE